MVGAANWLAWNQAWKPILQSLATEAMQGSDSGHDLQHVERVVANAYSLGPRENCLPEITLPAAWLHDCVSLPKNSPERSMSSRLAGIKAVEMLQSVAYPVSYLPDIQHCIESHSFSAGIPCRTAEARVVQDADRLEALGAIGIARCLMTGGSLGQRLYDPQQPFPIDREARDTLQSIDHFFVKLFRLPATMQTEAGRAEAHQRVAIMQDFLAALGRELALPHSDLRQALAAISL